MMSLPSTDAFTTGWRFSASQAAFTKKLMKPSLMPWVFSNCSPTCLRIATTFERLTSLNEVSIAMEFFDCISRSAMRARMRVIGTRSSGRVPGVAARAAGTGAAAGEPPWEKLTRSSLVTRPPRPVPGTCEASMFSSVATRRPAGERPSFALAAAGAGLAGSALAGAAGFLVGRGRLRRFRDRAFLEDADHVLAVDGVAGAVADFLQHAVGGSRHFQHHLVGFEVDQVFIALHRVARLLVPGGDGGIADGFGQYRNLDFDRHDLSLDGSFAAGFQTPWIKG